MIKQKKIKIGNQEHECFDMVTPESACYTINLGTEKPRRVGKTEAELELVARISADLLEAHKATRFMMSIFLVAILFILALSAIAVLLLSR